MKLLKIAAAAAVVAPLCAGCASVLESSTQPVTVATAPEAGAACNVSNDRGAWPLVSPGTVVIKKSESVLEIDCSKAGFQDAKIYTAPKISTAAEVGMMMPYVGLLNAAVDGSSGAAQSYPATYVLTMKPVVAAATPAAQPQPQAASASSH